MRCLCSLSLCAFTCLQNCSPLKTKQIIDRVYATHGPLLVSSPAANDNAGLNARTLHLTAYARALKDKKHVTAVKALEAKLEPLLEECRRYDLGMHRIPLLTTKDRNRLQSKTRPFRLFERRSIK